MNISELLKKLVPVDQKFFPMFEHLSDLLHQVSMAQYQIFEHDDPTKQKDLFKVISDVEEKADQVVEEIFNQLDKSFVPPFDREDIHHLVTSIDAVVDQIHGISKRIQQYRPKDIPAEYRAFSKLIVKGTEQIDAAIHELRSLKKPGKILKACKRIQELEREADGMYHTLISDLFRKEKDSTELIKQKEILENFERMADAIKGVSDHLKTIILKIS